MIDCEFENFVTKPAISYAVYRGDWHTFKENEIRNCSFHNCRQPIKFENGADERADHHGDSLIIDHDDVVAPEFCVLIKDCDFDINEVLADGVYSLLTPMAIWIEAQGIYNLLVDNCFIDGTGQALPHPNKDNDECNFRNGIVIDQMDGLDLSKINIAVTRPRTPPPQGHGYIEAVFDNGILIKTSEDSRIITELIPGIYPRRNDSGLTNLDIYGCVTGCGIKVDAGSTYSSSPKSEIGVFESEIQGNEGAGIQISIQDEAVLDTVSIKENTLYDNNNGGILVDCTGGESELELADNDIYDTFPDTDQGYAGIRLETLYPHINPSHLEVALDGNRLHELEGDGLVIMAADPDADFTILSSNDRIYENMGDGVLLDNGTTLGFFDARMYYLTSCYNSGMGISFDDALPATLIVNVVNSIFWGNIINGDVDPNYAGTISYSDWAEGFNYGGAGHNNSIESDPHFVDDEYHLQYNPTYPSECVDSGDNTAAPGVRRDMEGDDRKIDGDGDQEVDTDMGADEHDPG